MLDMSPFFGREDGHTIPLGNVMNFRWSALGTHLAGRQLLLSLPNLVAQGQAEHMPEHIPGRQLSSGFCGLLLKSLEPTGKMPVVLFGLYPAHLLCIKPHSGVVPSLTLR